MLVDHALTYSEIDAAIKRALPKEVTSYYLFDAYEGAFLGADKKSLAFAFVYQDPEKTLSDDEVNVVHDRFVAQLQAALPIGVR
jgi:phenylalanyl-tRNA synthetase beta chain